MATNLCSAFPPSAPSQEIIASLQEEVRLLGSELQVLRGLPEDLLKLRSDLEARLSLLEVEPTALIGQDLPASGANSEADSAPGVSNAEKGIDERESDSSHAQSGGRRRSSLGEVLEVRSHHEFASSLWDACVVLGRPQVGAGGSLILILGLLMNTTLQLLFCWIVFTAFLDDDAKYSVDLVEEWRLLYGHNIHLLDPSSGASLVSKVCNGGFIDREWWQAGLLSEASDYLQVVMGPDRIAIDKVFSTGVVLCFMAIWLWAFFIMTEVQLAASFICGVHMLPKGLTIITQEGPEDFKIQSISYFRLVALTCVGLARIFIALLLGFMGAEWLSLTRDVETMMLNAAALIFVLDIDELLFLVLAPKTAASFLNEIQKLDTGRRRYWQGIDIAPVLKLLAICTVIPIFVTQEVSKRADQAAAVMNKLCGGHLDFVYGVHEEIGPIFIADTPRYDPGSATAYLPGTLPLLHDAVFNYAPGQSYMWRGDTAGRGKLAIQLTTAQDLLRKLVVTASEASEDESGFGGGGTYDLGCEDKGGTWWSNDWLWPTITALTSAEVTDCSKAEQYCDQKDLPLIRMVCPESCGCLDPGSGLLHNIGCREPCEDEEYFSDALTKAPCHDVLDIETARRAGWERWWREFYRSYVGSWGTENVMMQFAIQDDIGNCSFLASENWIHERVCTNSAWAEDRPASLFCPVTCGCFSSDAFTGKRWCPSSCPNAST